MKICISSSGKNLTDAVDPRFGRCRFFLITDKEGNLEKVIPNESAGAMRGAGISAAQLVINEKVNAVITGNVGPNAFMVLNQAGVKIYPSVFGKTAKEALDLFNEGKIEETKEALPPSGPMGGGFGRGGPGKGIGGGGGGYGRGGGRGRF